VADTGRSGSTVGVIPWWEYLIYLAEDWNSIWSQVEKLKTQAELIMDECLEEFILRSVPTPISKGQKRFFIY
jgi:hypothetical protein